MPTDDEWRLLLPQIERIARSVANRCNASRTVRDEFAASAVSHVYAVYEKFDPGIASFRTWCGTVLRNHCVNLIRSEARGRKALDKLRDCAVEREAERLDAPPPPSPAEERETQAEQAAAQRGGSAVGLVERLEKLASAQDRILVAAYYGVLSACGAETVDRWCREAGWAHAESLRALEQVPRTKRKRAIAGIVGSSADWVRQHIFRAIGRLKDGEVGGPL